MTQLGSFVFALVVLAAAGGMFALQYKLSLREKVWGIFLLPAVFVVLYLAVSTTAFVKGTQFTDQAFSTTDDFGNTLEMTIQVPKDGKVAGLFSDLYIYDENHVLLDEITLSYNNKGKTDRFVSKGYADEIAKMTGGVQLHGTSMQREEVAGRLYFLGASMGKEPFKLFAVPFGIPVVLLILVGGLARVIQSKRLRRKSLDKIDIQSFESHTRS